MLYDSVPVCVCMCVYMCVCVCVCVSHQVPPQIDLDCVVSASDTGLPFQPNTLAPEKEKYLCVRVLDISYTISL